MNLRWQKAVTQHTDLPFNSVAVFGGQVVAGSDSGLFVMGGQDDNGTDIDAYVLTPVTDLGSTGNKAVRHGFLNLELNGDLTVTAIADGENERSATASTEEVTDLQGQRVVFGRDVNGRNIQLKVENVGGSDFNLDSVELLIIPRANKPGR